MPGPNTDKWEKRLNKGVRAKNGEPIGVVQGEEGKTILIATSGMSEMYRVPKEKLAGFDGSELRLSIDLDELSQYTQRDQDVAAERTIEVANEITDRVKDAAEDLGVVAMQVTKRAADKLSDAMETTERKTKKKSRAAKRKTKSRAKKTKRVVKRKAKKTRKKAKRKVKAAQRA